MTVSGLSIREQTVYAKNRTIKPHDTVFCRVVIVYLCKPEAQNSLFVSEILRGPENKDLKRFKYKSFPLVDLFSILK